MGGYHQQTCPPSRSSGDFQVTPLGADPGTSETAASPGKGLLFVQTKPIKGHRGNESRPLSQRGGARKKLTAEEIDRLTANMWTHPDATVARSGALDAMVQRWQKEVKDPDDFEEVEA